MAADVPDDLIEIHDPEIDVAQIMQQIRARIRQRREELGEPRQSFPTFGLAPYPGEPEGGPHSPALYHHLRVANEIYADMDTEPALPPSPASRLPVIGRLWQQVRPAVHTLILFYVNRAAGQQIEVNRHLISVLNELTALSQAQQTTIAALQADLQAARARSKD